MANFHSLKNTDFILKSKMVELNQNNNSKKTKKKQQINQMQCENFNLPWK